MQLYMRQEGKLLFNCTFKSHWLSHACLLSGFISPRVGQCYVQEDLMEKVRRLVALCCRGRRPISAVHKALSKYSVALHVEFS